jgi:exonuclease III
MKIVSWNCCFKLCETKAKEIQKMYENTDIFIIQECKEKEIDNFGLIWKYKKWYGDKKDSNLGIAIFSKEYKIDFSDSNDEFNRDFRYVIPYKITKDKSAFTLFAVWTKDGKISYDKNVTKAISWYNSKKLLNNAIVIGDFNTFAKNKNDLIKLEKNLHPLINCAKETKYYETNTYYHEKNKLGINDFCFVSEHIKAKITIPENGWDDEDDKFHSWKGLSDHCPICVEFAL